MVESSKKFICHLCGQPIDNKAKTLGERISREHVPPKQFFPKKMRTNLKAKLRTAPAHKRCNNSYRDDEEYFYHAMFALVSQNNSTMGKTIFEDFARRTHKPQTPAMMRNILRTRTNTTENGIPLTPGIYQLDIDLARSQNIVLKIARGLFYLDQGRYLPLENCIDVRLCEVSDDVPELYSLTWQADKEQGVCPDVFSYKYFNFEGLHLWSMLFWRSFMFCTVFEDPSA